MEFSSKKENSDLNAGITIPKFRGFYSAARVDAAAWVEAGPRDAHHRVRPASKRCPSIPSSRRRWRSSMRLSTSTAIRSRPLPSERTDLVHLRASHRRPRRPASPLWRRPRFARLGGPCARPWIGRSTNGTMTARNCRSLPRLMRSGWRELCLRRREQADRFHRYGRIFASQWNRVSPRPGAVDGDHNRGSGGRGQ